MPWWRWRSSRARRYNTWWWRRNLPATIITFVAFLALAFAHIALTTSHTIILATPQFTSLSYKGITADAHLIHTDSLWRVAIIRADPALANRSLPHLHALTDIVLDTRPMPRTMVVTLGNVADQNLAVVALELLETLAELRALVADTVLVASTTGLVVGEGLLLLQNL